MNEKIPIKIYNQIDNDYLIIIKEIITNDEFKKRISYHHHENRSVYGHCLIVSLRSYEIAKILHLDYKTAAIAGLLHDFYYDDWQLNKIKKSFFKGHGFVHAQEAYLNSKIIFPDLINKKVENAIRRHMFPLNIIPPLYVESWIICFVDKYSSMEIFLHPKQLYKYIGIKKEDKK